MATILTPDLPELTLAELLQRYQNARRRRKMERVYRPMLASAQQLATPKIIYQRFEREAVAELEQWFTSETVGAFLAVCTLGAELDAYEQEIGRNDIASAAVLDEICVKLVVRLTNHLHRTLRAELAPYKLKVGPPYRPGVGKWPIETQHIVFDQLPTDQINVELTADLFMRPLKSISLIIPILDKSI